MTKQDKKKYVISMWGLIAASNCAQFYINEIEDIVNPKKEVKRELNKLKMANKGFLNRIEKRSSTEERAMITDITTDQLAIMASALNLFAQVPRNEIDWLYNELDKLAFAAINRSNLEKSAE